MTRITFITHDGTRHPIEAAGEQSLMQSAMDNGVPGIDADCGGSCACGTCHVIVADTWQERVGTAGEEERSLLEFTPEPQPGSRLACQVQVRPELDGLEVHLPEFQM